jgi:hypothetical protein
MPGEGSRLHFSDDLGEPLVALQKRQHLRQEVVKCHDPLSIAPDNTKAPGFDSARCRAYNTTLAREGSNPPGNHRTRDL